MAESPPAARRSRLLETALLLFVGLALYVLSIGPANALHARGALGDWSSFVERFYVPLGFAYERVPVVKVAIDAWMELWSHFL